MVVNIRTYNNREKIYEQAPGDSGKENSHITRIRERRPSAKTSCEWGGQRQYERHAVEESERLIIIHD